MHDSQGLNLILWKRLQGKLSKHLGSAWENKLKIIYGTGGQGKNFLRTYKHLDIAYAVDSDINKQGKKFEGLVIKSPEALLKEDLDNILVFITSSYYQEISITLKSMGLIEGSQFVLGNQSSSSRLLLYVNANNIKKAFDWFNSNGIEYVILRWYENIANTVDDDIDILVRTSDLLKLVNCPYLTDEDSDVNIEVYWSEPLGKEDELAYYPPLLAGEILANREKKDYFYTPDDYRLLNSLVYHLVFHKAERSGWPENLHSNLNGFKRDKYLSKIVELSGRLECPIRYDLDGLWNYLESAKWLPPIDLARRYAVAMNSSWLKKKYAARESEKNELLFLILRDWIIERPAAKNYLIEEFKMLGAKKICSVPLNESERRKAINTIRGGNWIESEGSLIGGFPGEILVFNDPRPKKPSYRDLRLRPFCMNYILSKKSHIKEKISREFNKGTYVNCFHTSDDELEGLEYLTCLEGINYETAKSQLYQLHF